jgi:cyclophilin family peptidyl-prolyl cis-trans isomerase
MKAVAAFALLLVGCSTGASAPASLTTAITCPVSAAPSHAQAATINAGVTSAVVSTSLGSFTIELYPTAAPMATANFVALATCHFYDQITFHRVVAGFVIQAGDPQTKAQRGVFDGLGTGGPGYQFGIEPPADGYHYDAYEVAMANAGAPDTNGSQFFIDLADLDAQLARSYTIFGKVVDGTAIVDAIGSVATNGAQDPPTPAYVPLQPVIISSVTIKTSS